MLTYCITKFYYIVHLFFTSQLLNPQLVLQVPSMIVLKMELTTTVEMLFPAVIFARNVSVSMASQCALP